MSPEGTRVRSGLRLQLLQAAGNVYHRLPFPGLKQIARHVWNRLRPPDRVVIASVDGITYELHLRELIDSHLYYLGAFEAQSSTAIRRLCRPGDVALDIGANIGCHALKMAALTGESGRVIAFEPMPWARAKLERNLSLNAFRNVTVVSHGLSDAPGSARVHFRSSWSQIADGGTTETPASTEPATIEFVRLDDYLAAARVDRVDFIKLDVDGYEPQVLRGARQTLAAHHPIILMELVEYPQRAPGDALASVLALLADLGYRFFEETTFEPYPSIDALIAAVPRGSGINVVASCRPLRP
jgi:FkbM family methyltransferase